QILWLSANTWSESKPGTAGNAKLAMNRADYRTPEWRALRRQVLERERGLCQLCGGVANDAHHETYRFGVLCPPEFLTALCHRCHLAEHGRVPSVGTREFTSDRP